MPTLIPLHFLSLLAFAILRIVLGIFFLERAYERLFLIRRIKKEMSVGVRLYIGLIAEIIVGTLFFLGFLTQIAGLLGVYFGLRLRARHAHDPHRRALYTFVCASSFVLIITGPGIFGIDLPL